MDWLKQQEPVIIWGRLRPQTPTPDRSRLDQGRRNRFRFAD
jgi:hypothetical protein